ncbi:uncharacterized protein LOC121530150 [Drosophila eugracilis]|uniref:uncharacterized protein LOC121530150 n=1 Tax=Drosophila eugracilis TaxID=29029 RepID=UPI001BDB2EC6|nr:uncharacterized protein LOC121530150 [Drosophila eugracilis]
MDLTVEFYNSFEADKTLVNQPFGIKVKVIGSDEIDDQDSDVEIIEDSEPDCALDLDDEDTVDRYLREVFDPPSSSTQTTPSELDSLGFEDFPMGKDTQEVLRKLILLEQSEEQYKNMQCAQTFDLDESEPSLFPNDDHIFNEIIENEPQTKYQQLMDDGQDSVLMDVLLRLDS